MQIVWKITFISQLEEINWLKKQSIVIEDTDKNQLAVDFLWDKLNELDWVQAWDTVTVTYWVKVNFSGKFFNRVSGKTLTKADTTQV